LTADGDTAWNYDTGNQAGGTRDSGLCQDATHCWAGGGRNAVWAGNDGTNKSIWKLTSTAGNLVSTLDTGGNVDGVALKANGDLIASGVRNSNWPGAGGVNANLWCFQPDGTILWTADEPGFINGGAVVVDSDQNVIIYCVFSGVADLVRLNGTTGVKINQVLCATDNDATPVLTIDAMSNGFIVIGGPFSGSFREWNRYANALAKDYGVDSTNINSADACAGNTDFQWFGGNRAGGGQPFLSKVDNTGALEWQVATGASTVSLFAVDIASDNSSIIIGQSNGNVRKYDADGVVVWSKSPSSAHIRSVTSRIHPNSV